MLFSQYAIDYLLCADYEEHTDRIHLVPHLPLIIEAPS